MSFSAATKLGGLGRIGLNALLPDPGAAEASFRGLTLEDEVDDEDILLESLLSRSDFDVDADDRLCLEADVDEDADEVDDVLLEDLDRWGLLVLELAILSKY